MYSRYHGSSDPSVKIPENYRGWAFSENHPSAVRHFIPPDSGRKMEIAKPTAERYEAKPEIDPSDNAPQTIALPVSAQEVDSTAKIAPDESARAQAPLPFLQEIGFEELLLLGLIVLLSQSEKGNDVVLWLILLLFSG